LRSRLEGALARGPTERIDGIVALFMAIGRALVAQDEPQPEFSLFFVEVARL
jgi:hypothetical protein